MYEGGKGGGGAAGIIGGAVVLPDTGGNIVLQIVALVSIVAGTAIVLSTIARFAAKRAHKA
jgi:hypothetical protein